MRHLDDFQAATKEIAMSIRNLLFATAFSLASLGPPTPMAYVRSRRRASTSAMYRVSPTTPSSAMGFMSSRRLRRASWERRSVSCPFLQRASVWSSRHRTRPVQSRSAGGATSTRPQDGRCLQLNFGSASGARTESKRIEPGAMQDHDNPCAAIPVGQHRAIWADCFPVPSGVA